MYRENDGKRAQNLCEGWRKYACDAKMPSCALYAPSDSLSEIIMLLVAVRGDDFHWMAYCGVGGKCCDLGPGRDVGEVPQVGNSNIASCADFSARALTQQLRTGLLFVFSLLLCSFIVLPGGNTWHRATQGFLFLLALVFSFLGIAIISDMFMAAIETITATTKTVRMPPPGSACLVLLFPGA